MFCVRQSSVRGCRFSFVFVYFVIKCVECSPVPASFFPYRSTALQSDSAVSALLGYAQEEQEMFEGEEVETEPSQSSCTAYVFGGYGS